jgi:hypothetical protein
MITKNVRAFFGLTLLACGSAAYMGCVSDRPSRNGVFNENQYIRKDFLLRSADPGSGVQKDDGWLLKATITEVSSPNPLGNLSVFGVFAGSQAAPMIVKFRVSQDKLSLINNRELSSTPTDQQSGRVARHARRSQVPHQSRWREDELLRGEPGARLASSPMGEGQLREERPERHRAVLRADAGLARQVHQPQRLVGDHRSGLVPGR